jgi:hypothetical protein
VLDRKTKKVSYILSLPFVLCFFSMDLNPYELDFSAPFDEPLFDSSSDDELELTLVVAIAEERLNNERRSTSHCGSVHGRRFISRDILQGHDRLFHDYFTETPVYSPNLFRRRL